MTETDLNDFRFFAEVVAHGGFAAAGRALRQPKSKLSRRIAGLETRLGVRLIERSSRRFQVTEIGRSFYERCRAMLLEAEQAEALIAEAQAEPHGRVRMGCPTGMVELVSQVLPAFLTRYPRVRLQIVAVDRPVDLIGERIDVALRIRTELTSDASLTMRTLGRSYRILVASPVMANRVTGDPACLAALPTLGTTDDLGEIEWHLATEDGRTQVLHHEPRLNCADFLAVRAAAVNHLGIALLPDHACREQLRSGQLVNILPEWRGHPGIVHLVFTTRRGLPPAVRAWIDALAKSFSEGFTSAT